MNQAIDPTWASSLESLWHSPNFPMWLTLIAAGFFAVIFVITVFRADRSLANGALTVITLLAIGIAVTAMMRASSALDANNQAGALPTAGQLAGSLPALSCLDGLAGENVETACEKALFASADSTAAAVSYSAAQITKLEKYGPLAAANKVMTPELQALRRAVERDRFGLIAHVLTVRDGERPISSVLSYFFKGRVLPYYTGSHPDARDLGSNDLMYWALMRRAVERGCDVFDFGRSKVGTGPYAFKRNWGFEPRPITHQYRLLGAEALPNLNPTNPRYAAFIQLWRRLPLPVANGISPLLSRSLG